MRQCGGREGGGHLERHTNGNRAGGFSIQDRQDSAGATSRLQATICEDLPLHVVYEYSIQLYLRFFYHNEYSRSPRVVDVSVHGSMPRHCMHMHVTRLKEEKLAGTGYQRSRRLRFILRVRHTVATVSNDRSFLPLCMMSFNKHLVSR